MRYLRSVLLSFTVYIFYAMVALDGYDKYQTFDEYILQGVSPLVDRQLEKPYVLVKKDLDTIYIMFSTQKHNIPRKYIKKDNYWYNLETKYNYCEPRFKCDVPFVRYVEKYIYNDTILTYEYLKNEILNEDIDLLRSITVDTKANKMQIGFDNSVYIDNKNKFRSLKYLVDNYKSEFPYYSRGYQPKSYRYFSKEIKGDTLFLYEGNSKSRSLYDVRILNSLREYNPYLGENIITEIEFNTLQE